MELELTGRVVLVSGGSRGIGRAIAGSFAREGAFVAIAARNPRDLEDARQDIEENCSVHVVDATDAAACLRLVDEVMRRWGRLDVLVTCAGSGRSVPPGQETAEEWQRVIAVNLFSATNVITATVPYMAQAGGGTIVCVSSICGREALGAPATYSAAKSALDAMVKNVSRPFGRQGIRINAVSPGNIYFEGGTWDAKLRESPKAVQAMLEQDVPLGCLGKPEWIADAVVFLASARACFITGANLVVDGGQTRGL